MSQFDRFVGLLWIDQGRDLAGVDCYGLVWLAFRELRGIEIASLCDRYVTGADRRDIAGLIDGELDRWAEIAPGHEAPFDVVLVRDGRFVSHVGLVTQPGMMLHVARGGTSVIERYRTGQFQHRIAGFYRLK